MYESKNSYFNNRFHIKLKYLLQNLCHRGTTLLNIFTSKKVQLKKAYFYTTIGLASCLHNQLSLEVPNNSIFVRKRQYQYGNKVLLKLNRCTGSFQCTFDTFSFFFRNPFFDRCRSSVNHSFCIFQTYAKKIFHLLNYFQFSRTG